MTDQTSQSNRRRSMGTIKDFLREQTAMANEAEQDQQDEAAEETDGASEQDTAHVAPQDDSPAPQAEDRSLSSNTADEVAKLKHELKSAQGRLKPTQQRLEAATSTISNQEAMLADKQRRIDELEAELDSLQDLRLQKRIEERREKILERSPGIDIDHAEAMAYALEEERQQNPARKSTPKPSAEDGNPDPQGVGHNDNVKIKVGKLLNDPRRNVGSLTTLIKDPDFVTWAETKRPNVPNLITRLTTAASETDVDMLADALDAELEHYFTNTDEAEPVGVVSPPVAKASVADHMTRKRPAPVSRADYKRKRQALMREVRSSSPSVRDKAAAELQKLHNAFLQIE